MVYAIFVINYKNGQNRYEKEEISIQMYQELQNPNEKTVPTKLIKSKWCHSLIEQIINQHQVLYKIIHKRSKNKQKYQKLQNSFR